MLDQGTTPLSRSRGQIRCHRLAAYFAIVRTVQHIQLHWTHWTAVSTGDRKSRIRCILHVRVEAIRAERLPLWLNLVERFFAEITDKRIRRGTFCSVGELVRAIRDYIRRRNHRPRPFVWTASARSIARKVRRCNEVLETGD
jgi:hypothetical protein